eukprot:SAG25_NODE_154_length_13563_cov_44.588978_9_plen_33_part_00
MYVAQRSWRPGRRAVRMQGTYFAAWLAGLASQ